MNVVGYCRLSHDEDKENYASIEEQQNIIMSYAASRNWVINKFYIDDNFSGYSFDRPAFAEMIERVEKGLIDVVLAKDLSRIGRNNGRVLVLIDEFKRLEKNMILIEEYGGVYDVLNDKDDTIGITTWFNERYVKDISRKVRANMHSKQKNGKLVMGNYYGYVKDPNEKTKLIVDEDLRPCIEQVFKLYIEGLGYKKICDALNNKGYPTPSSYYKQKHTERGRVYKHNIQEKWETYMIKNILTNDVYTGTLRTHKKQKNGIRGKMRDLPVEAHYTFDNHHEAIVSKEDYELANAILSKRNERSYRGSAKYDYIFSGFCVCADCGFAVTGRRLRRKEPTYGYNCTTYIRYGGGRCSSHETPESRLIRHLKVFLEYMKEQYEEYLQTLNFAEKKVKIADTMGKSQKELYEINEELKLLYAQKIKDLLREPNIEYQAIIENSYKALEEDKKKKISELNKRIEELKRVNSNDIEKRIKTAIGLFDEVINSEVPSRKVLELILDKVYFYKDRSVKFKLLVDIDEMAYEAEG